MAEELTAAVMLREVNKAIYAVLVGGQSYQIGSRKLTRADLAQLYDMRDELAAEVAADDDDGCFSDTYVAMFNGR